MLRIAGQTTGPIGMKFFLDTYGWPGDVKGLKFKKKMKYCYSKVFFSIFFTGSSASHQ